MVHIAMEVVMGDPSGGIPTGTHPISGIVHNRSPHTVGNTVDRLTEAICAAGAKLFAVIDHSGEAERAGLSLRDTKLLIFGNPVGGTPVMAAAPLAALDLPLKVLVWQDDGGAVWMSCLAPGWLAARYGLNPDLSAPLSAVGTLIAQVTAPC
jgi:uncharacterized protein (DUF302 family)